MLLKKIKLFIENISSIRLLWMNEFLIIDINDNYANIVFIKYTDNPFKIKFNLKNPKFKIVSQIETNVNNLKSAIETIINQQNLKNASLILIINKFKFFNIALSKELIDENEDNSIEDLIKKHLPANLTNNEFILHYEKLREDESLEHYLVTIIRKIDIEKYFGIFNYDIFKLKFAIPFIYAISLQKNTNEKIYSLIDFKKESLIYYQLNKEENVLKDEYFIDSEFINSDNDYINFSKEKIIEIIRNIKSTNEMEIEKTYKVFLYSIFKQNDILNKLFAKLKLNKEDGICYEYDNNIKHKLIYFFLFNDKILNFNIEKYFSKSGFYDIEKKITTRIIVTVSLILIVLLLLSYGLNLFSNNSVNEISLQNQNILKLEDEIKKTNEYTEKLKYDLKLLNQLRHNEKGISILLKIISFSSNENLFLTDLKIKKNNYEKYEVKLNGEAYSKDEVINYIKNLEAVSELSHIELIWFDKKSNTTFKSNETSNNFQFSIVCFYNGNKDS